MLAVTAALTLASLAPQDRPRAQDLGLTFGSLRRGERNAITDVPGVRVGHATVVEGERVRTGVTVILPHGDDPFRSKVPAAIFTMNGYGKLAGVTQVDELGEIESPIALTNTLNVGLVTDALVGWVLDQPGNERVRSVNCVVGETNDGTLNDIRGRHVKAEHVRAALAAAKPGPVAEGSVGAGTGTICFGFKGGIGTSSRVSGEFTVGVLVQSNFGGALTIAGVPVHAEMRARIERPGRRRREARIPDQPSPDHGSCMIVIATDAPLDARNLERLAKRAVAGMARTGASFSNGSGDYVIAFSNAKDLRRAAGARRVGAPVLANASMSGLFRAAADATEEAIVNSLLRATTVRSATAIVRAIDVAALREVLAKFGRGGE